VPTLLQGGLTRGFEFWWCGVVAVWAAPIGWVGSQFHAMGEGGLWPIFGAIHVAMLDGGVGWLVSAMPTVR